jgi:hypothetical protein
MSKESFHVKLSLSGTFYEKRPIFSVLLNDTPIISHREISADSDVTEFIEFDANVSTGDNSISLIFENKGPRDTIENEDKTSIIKDMLLNIVDIEFDDISLGNLLYELGEYKTDAPVTINGEETTLVKNCVNLGWNGVWTLHFTSPFYIWMLENV